MKSMIKKRLIVLILVSILIIIAPSLAVNIGVSPGVANFKNMLRGGYAERSIRVTIASEEKIPVEVSVRGEVAEWMNFSSMRFEVSRNQPYNLKVIMRPPSDIENGEYEGFIRILTGGLGSVGAGQAGSVVRAAVDVIVKVNIIDNEIRACRAKQFRVNSVEKGTPLEFKMHVSNDGNIQLNPLVTIDIWDQERENIVKMIQFDGQEILPTVEDDIIIRVPTDDFEIGQYWADIAIDECGEATDTLTFDILEKGMLRSNGILKKIISKVWTTVGKTIPIEIIFENTGEKEVTAKFKGKISRGDEIIKILESEELTVPIAKTINFTLFFTPKKIGRYVVSGRVFYDKKRTYEMSTVINVTAAEEKDFNWKYFIYIIILLMIMFLLWKIRREKQRKIKELTKYKE